MEFFVSPAYAQAAGGAGSALGSFLPLILIFAIMYFLLIRPQQKKAKEHAAMVAAVRRGDQVITTVSDLRLAVDLAQNGVARVVLPTFAAEGISGLSRLSEPIEELTHEEWIVTHHEARHDPPVRRAIDALTRFIERG